MTEQNKRLIELMKHVGVVDEKTLQERLKHAYYTGEPVITDAEYDELFGDKDYVGYAPDADGPWQVLPHRIPMGSLNKLKTWEQAKDWLKDKGKVLWEPKLDGLSIELVYEGGKLTHAILRGGGDRGEDILKNAKNFQYVPQTIEHASTYVSVRGEVVISQSAFDQLRQTSGADYSNRRNCVPGICRRYDGKYSDFLSFWAYDIIEDNCEPDGLKEYSSELEKLTTLYSYGFKLPFAYPIMTEDQYNKYGDIRDTAEEFQMDGLVIKSMDMQHQIALKFEPNGERTTVTNYTWDVGSTGKLVPVIWFEPISIGGSTLKKASGASLKSVRDLNAPVGSLVEVKKMNDVIPKVTKCVQQSSTNLSDSIPTVCPICGSVLVEQGSDLYCLNKQCPVKIEQSCTAVYWAVYMKGITDSWIKQLLTKGIITKPSDVLRVKPEDIASLDGYSINKANKIMAHLITECKTIIENDNITKLLWMLPIPTIAGKAYDKLAEDLRNIQQFEELLEFGTQWNFKPVLGNAKGTKVNEYFTDNKAQILDLIRTMRTL